MISHEANTSPDGSTSQQTAAAPTLHDHFDRLADRIARRELVGLVLFDASAMEDFERSRGPASFEAFFERLHAAVDALRGSTIRDEDLLCRNAPGGDALLLFLARPRTENSHLRPVDFKAIVERTRQQLCDSPLEDVPALRAAWERLSIGASLVAGDVGTDPRREIYRSLRNARRDIRQGRRHEKLERRHLVDTIISERRIVSRFQPIVALSSGDTIGWEALSQPDDATRPRLERSMFLEAERVGRAAALDVVCRELAIRRHPTLAERRSLFINCLPETFIDPGDHLEAVIRRWTDAEAVRPGQLVFELNENVSQPQLARMLPTIRDLRRRGFRFALDDMGTGTTNLRVLVELEPEFIKLDKSLIQNLADNLRQQALVSYMVDLARRSDSELIAEGIESAADRRTAAELGVHYAQGYHLGRPRFSEAIDFPASRTRDDDA